MADVAVSDADIAKQLANIDLGGPADVLAAFQPAYPVLGRGDMLCGVLCGLFGFRSLALGQGSQTMLSET